MTYQGIRVMLPWRATPRGKRQHYWYESDRPGIWRSLCGLERRSLDLPLFSTMPKCSKCRSYFGE